MKTLILVVIAIVVVPFFLYLYGRVVTTAVMNTIKHKKEESKDGNKKEER